MAAGTGACLILARLPVEMLVALDIAGIAGQQARESIPKKRPTALAFLQFQTQILSNFLRSR